VTPSAVERLDRPDAFLSRSDLRELGLERRAVDAVFRRARWCVCRDIRGRWCGWKIIGR
jgi:hypothetical protein